MGKVPLGTLTCPLLGNYVCPLFGVSLIRGFTAFWHGLQVGTCKEYEWFEQLLEQVRMYACM